MKNSKRFISLFLVVAILCSLIPSGAIWAAEPPSNRASITLPEGSYVPGQLIVGIADNMSLTQNEINSIGTRGTSNGERQSQNNAVMDMFSSIDILSVRDLTDDSRLTGESARRNSVARSMETESAKGRQILLMELGSDNQTDMWNAIEALEKNPMVAYAEPNIIGHATSTIPNDTYYNNLWGMDKIQAPEAWDIETGTHEILVGVMDSGVDYYHPDLIGNVEEFVDVNTSLGYNFLYNNNYWSGYYSPDPMDDNCHGTHVAGTIGAVGNNSDGVVGVCWEVTIIPLKIWDSRTSGPMSAFIDAMYYAEYIQIPILNISGGYLPAWHDVSMMQGMRDAVEQYSGLLIAAAGNEWLDADYELDNNYGLYCRYPAVLEYDNIIAVAALENDDTLAEFSTYGATSVDLAAPGCGIFSTLLNGGYFNLDGTSMAAPHVAGAAALMLSSVPSLTAAQIKSAILDNVDELPTLSGLVLTGGSLNVNKALQSVQPKVDHIVVSFDPPWLAVPDIGSVTTTVSAKAYDKSGMELNVPISLSILSIPNGVTYDPLTGIITVDYTADTGNVYIKASAKDIINYGNINIYKDVIMWSPLSDSLFLDGILQFGIVDSHTYTIVSDMTTLVHVSSYMNPFMRYWIYNDSGSELVLKDYFAFNPGVFLMEGGMPYTVKVEFFVGGDPSSYYTVTLETAVVDGVLGDPAEGTILIDGYAYKFDGFGVAYEFASNQTTTVNVKLDFDIFNLGMYQISDSALIFTVFDEDGNLMGKNYHLWPELYGTSIISFEMEAGKNYTVCVNLNGYAYYEPVTYSLTVSV